MPTVGWKGAVGLAVALLAAGCSRTRLPQTAAQTVEERLVNEQIATLNSLADVYEKVTDKESWTLHEPQTRPLWDKLNKVTQEFHALPSGNKEAAVHAHSEELDAANTRMTTAQESAVKAKNR